MDRLRRVLSFTTVIFVALSAHPASATHQSERKTLRYEAPGALSRVIEINGRWIGGITFPPANDTRKSPIGILIEDDLALTEDVGIVMACQDWNRNGSCGEGINEPSVRTCGTDLWLPAETFLGFDGRFPTTIAIGPPGTCNGGIATSGAITLIYDSWPE